MAEHEKELHFTVVYRGKPLQLKALTGSTLGELGNEIVDLTGVAPHTLRLILPKRPPLQPMSEKHSAKLLYQSGITEGMRMVMMGSSSVEVAAVSQLSKNDRIIGFSEEDQRAHQRSGHAAASHALPKGNYIFCGFQTLSLPGIELNPPPAMALKIMHKLASDRGITAIMNKYRWRVGIMTEMAPIGYVGISPKCILGFNKNRGQEISLRLRTDDLKGFRKYESIKKTLLHELAHMVHDEHDEKFHALDKKLNDEAIALDWTKSQGHTLSGVRLDDEDEEFEPSSSVGSRGYKVGGRIENFVDARAAAAAAALRRFGNAGYKPSSGESSQSTVIVTQPGLHSEPDPDEQDSESVHAIASGADKKDDAAADDSSIHIPVRSDEPDPDEASRDRLERKEPDPDEASNEHGASKGSDPEAMSIVTNAPLRGQEPDPDDASSAPSKNEPDPDEFMETLRFGEPDPDEAVTNSRDFSLRHHEPDPDEAAPGHSGNGEPDPDEAVDLPVDYPMKSHEPDPDEACSGCTCRDEPDPDEAIDSHSGRNEPDPDEAVDIVLDTPFRKQEPDPDEVSDGHICRNEPDPDEAIALVSDIPLRRQEPDPDLERAVKDAPDTVHVHNKSIGDRDRDECVGCRRMAGKRMKSSTGGGLTEHGEPQMSR
ncbi:unnamed protein product [Calypogeia fissa]